MNEWKQSESEDACGKCHKTKKQILRRLFIIYFINLLVWCDALFLISTCSFLSLLISLFAFVGLGSTIK